MGRNPPSSVATAFHTFIMARKRHGGSNWVFIRNSSSATIAQQLLRGFAGSAAEPEQRKKEKGIDIKERSTLENILPMTCIPKRSEIELLITGKLKASAQIVTHTKASAKNAEHRLDCNLTASSPVARHVVQTYT